MPFFPLEKAQFWRPFGIDTYWRFVETFLGGNVRIAHLMNLLLHILASCAVGWFIFTLLKLLDPVRNHFFAGGLVAFLYAIHAAHFLSVVWVSAANSSITVLFSSLMLAFWIKAYKTKSDRVENLLLFFALICFVLALLSKEIAVVLPVLIFLVSVYLWPNYKPSKNAYFVFIVFVAVACGWFIFRMRMTSLPNSAYEFKIGNNVARNALGFVLYFLNMPREVLRFLYIDAFSIGISLWGLFSIIFQFTSFSLFLYGAWEKLKIKGIFFVAVFFVVGCAPYFFFNWNNYAYYIEIGLVSYAIVIAFSVYKIKVALLATVFAMISSLISWTGNHFLEYPALISRATWAEKQLTNIEKQCLLKPALCSSKLYLSIENKHKFLSFDIYGLIYRLGFKEENIVILEKGQDLKKGWPALVVPSKGDVYFRG